jgi:carbon-monoxide dehydrogenase medium subunit
VPAILGMAARHIGHDAIRNRGTLGGSLAHADPAAELPATMVLVDAQIECRSRNGTRTVPARGFFTGPYMTVMHEDELLTAVRIPRPGPDVRYGFTEFSPRHGDYARAGAVCAVHAVDGTVRKASGVLFAIGVTPVDVSDALAAAQGNPLDDVAWDDLARAAVAALPAAEGADATARRRLAAVALTRALRQAAAGHSEESR